jgi:hypothetical protein
VANEASVRPVSILFWIRLMRTVHFEQVVEIAPGHQSGRRCSLQASGPYGRTYALKGSGQMRPTMVG